MLACLWRLTADRYVEQIGQAARIVYRQHARKRKQEVTPGCVTVCFCPSNHSSAAPRDVSRTESGSRSDRRGRKLSERERRSTGEEGADAFIPARFMTSQLVFAANQGPV